MPPGALPFPPVFLWMAGSQNTLTSVIEDFHRFEIKMKSIWSRGRSLPLGVRIFAIWAFDMSFTKPSANLTLQFLQSKWELLAGVLIERDVVAAAASEALGWLEYVELEEAGAKPRIFPAIHCPLYLHLTERPASLFSTVEVLLRGELCCFLSHTVTL